MLISASLVRFGDTLCGVECNIQLHDEPTAWSNSILSQILAAAAQLPALSQDDLLGTNALLFPALTTYTLACATFQIGDPSLLTTLKKNISSWISMDRIDQLIYQKSIKEALLNIVSQCTGEDLSHKSQIMNIIRIDIDFITAQLLVMLTHDESRRRLVAQRNEQAQALLNLFQELLDLTHLAPIRPRILTTMLVLSKRSSLYPQSLVLQGVKRQGDSSVAGGSFGDVWIGKMNEEVVAVKVIRCLDSSAKKRTHEAVLWKQLNHPNVLSFYGLYTWDQGPRSALCLVSPWAEHGNIIEYLRKTPGADRVRLLLDIACGLEYLHTFDPPVIHGDLKGTNILVTSSLRACIADFGLGTLTVHQGVQYTLSTTLEAGALLYRAPELLNRTRDERKPKNANKGGESMTLASDVYSFGCICYELFAGRPRFHKLGLFDAIMAVRENRPLEKPTAMNDTLWELILMCWQVDPISRPTASYVARHLESLLKAIQETAGCTSGPDHAPYTTMRTPSVASDVSLSESDDLTHNNELSEIHISTHAPSAEADPLSSGESSEPPPDDIQQINRQAGFTSIPKFTSSLTLLPSDSSWAITKGDLIIAVMGASGTGKSSFIKYAIPECNVVVSHDLESCTEEVRAFACLHPNGNGRKVILVDTPGFDDTERSDYDILKNIADWLKTTYKEDITLSGILHFHSIADNRMKGNPRKNLQMFQHLCGNLALENVILTTTHWDRVSEEIASGREAELKSSFWKPFIDKGSRVTRFVPSTFDSAWGIINQFTTTPHHPLAVQIEMVDLGKELHETSAFKFLTQWWKGIIKRINRVVRGSQSAPLEREFNKVMKERPSLEGNRSQRTTRPRLFPLRRYTTPNA